MPKERYTQAPARRNRRGAAQLLAGIALLCPVAWAFDGTPAPVFDTYSLGPVPQTPVMIPKFLNTSRQTISGLTLEVIPQTGNITLRSIPSIPPGQFVELPMTSACTGPNCWAEIVGFGQPGSTFGLVPTLVAEGSGFTVNYQANAWKHRLLEVNPNFTLPQFNFPHAWAYDVPDVVGRSISGVLPASPSVTIMCFNFSSAIQSVQLTNTDASGSVLSTPLFTTPIFGFGGTTGSFVSPFNIYLSKAKSVDCSFDFTQSPRSFQDFQW